MGMRVDDTRYDIFSRGVDHSNSFGGFDVLTNLLNYPFEDKDVPVRDGSVGDG